MTSDEADRCFVATRACKVSKPPKMMSFDKGDVFVRTHEHDKGWWLGAVVMLRRGDAPVRLNSWVSPAFFNRPPLRKHAQRKSTETSAPVTHEYLKARKSYTSKKPGQLSFSKGALFLLLERLDSGWCKVALIDHSHNALERGWVAESYMRPTKLGDVGVGRTGSAEHEADSVADDRAASADDEHNEVIEASHCLSRPSLWCTLDHLLSCFPLIVCSTRCGCSC